MEDEGKLRPWIGHRAIETVVLITEKGGFPQCIPFQEVVMDVQSEKDPANRRRASSCK